MDIRQVAICENREKFDEEGNQLIAKDNQYDCLTHEGIE